MKQAKIFDELLILKIRQGDNKAFELLVKRWNKKLLSFAYKYTKDVEGSKDIVQESWLAIFKGISRLKDTSKFSTWAFRVVYNKIMDWLNTRKKVNTLSSEIQEKHLEEETDENLNIRSYLEKLPVQHKLILTLFYLESQSIKQISEILKVPTGTIKSRIFYAREKLKKIIKHSHYENIR